MASKQLTQMKKQMASKMGGRKIHGFSCPHCAGYKTTKEGAREWFRSKVDKKKLPYSTHNPPLIIRKDPKYAKMKMQDFLKKYPEWKV